MCDCSGLKYVQSRLISILDEFVACTEKAGVQYMISYGTLLGACRHKGFIPWDNDVDVVMLRKDYDRLIEYFRNNNTGDYRLSCLELDGSYALYAKFVKIKGDDDLQSDFTHPNGLSIDVFPLDEAYSYNNIIQKVNEIRARSIKRAVVSKGKLKNRQIKESLIKHIIRWLYVLPYRLFNDEWLMRRAVSLCKKNNGKNAPDLVCYASIEPMRTEHIKREVWEPTTKLLFGEKYYTAPARYQEVLSTYYGSEYNSLPPEDKRVTHSEVDYYAWKKII